MKKYIAFLMCLAMVLSLFSCSSGEYGNEGDSSTQETGESGTTTAAKSDEESLTPNEVAMQAYAAAIRSEICVTDRDLGEIDLMEFCFPSDNLPLGESENLAKVILDMDADGIDEYIIQSPAKEHLILHFYDGKVYSYCFDFESFCSLKIDGSFHWSNCSDETYWLCGASRISFDGASINVKEIYKLKFVYGPDEAAKEYYLNGLQATRDEYLEYYNSTAERDRVSFLPLDVYCKYNISSEQAWNIVNEYWNNIDGHTEGACGTTIIHKVVLMEKPSDSRMFYHFAWQVERYSHIYEWWESTPPKMVETYEHLFVDARTGECKEYFITQSDALEIAKEHCKADENGYEMFISTDAGYYDVYVFIARAGGYMNLFEVWVDKLTGEIVTPDGKA